MKYNFNGWQRAAEVKAINNEYAGIETPLDLYDALCDAWCIETCAPRLRGLWSEHNKTCGQCSITAFLAQDIFGGEVYAVEVEGAGLHCYNKVGDVVFDLASEQFGDSAASLAYDCSLKQDRESEQHFANEEKRKRYELLKERIRRHTTSAERRSNSSQHQVEVDLETHWQSYSYLHLTLNSRKLK